MKTTNNHKPQSSFIKNITMGFLGLFVLFGQYAFKDKGQDSTSRAKVNSETSFPIHLELFNELRQDFSQAYLWSTANNTAVEKALKASWQDLSVYIDINFLRNRIDTGIAIHFILLKDASNNPYFSYAISYARIDPLLGITTMSFNGTSNYILLTDTGMNLVSANNLNQYKADYKDSIKVYRDYPTSVVYQIDTITHPALSYFDGGNFVEFYESNMSLATSSDLVLNFFNGAILNDSIRGTLSSLPLSLKVQTPVMAFGDSQDLFIQSGTFNSNNPYLYRAMDFGQLCPPTCK